MQLRLARPDDGAAVAAIYGHYVRTTAISFEEEAPDADEMGRRIGAALPDRPWLVAEEAGRVVGYAYAGALRPRPAYRWSVETSVYLDPHVRGRGLGGRVYGILLDLVAAQGFARAFAGITLPNEPSLRLHRALGFEEVGVYPRVGYKHGRWHDVWWGVLDLAPGMDGPPAEPRCVDDVGVGGLARIVSGIPSRGDGDTRPGR